MAKGVSLEEAAKRLEAAGTNFADRYEQGTRGKGGAWLENASKAGKNYDAGVKRAIAENKFESGVRSAGAEAFESGVRNKGVMNWPTGMSVAGEKYQRKTERFARLWNEALPTPRAARRSPQNLKRMQENVERFIRAAGGK